MTPAILNLSKKHQQERDRVINRRPSKEEAEEAVRTLLA
jgi:hypothetical protein